MAHIFDTKVTPPFLSVKLTTDSDQGRQLVPARISCCPGRGPTIMITTAAAIMICVQARANRDSYREFVGQPEPSASRARATITC